MTEATIENVDEPSKPSHKKKHTISNDDLYRKSTQFELWSFTHEQLVEVKRKVNEQGRQAAKEKFDQAYSEAKSAHPTAFASGTPELLPENMISLLTPEEEATYLDFYSNNIIKTCNFFKMPTQVKLTAASFFKKFYLVNSVMEYHPKNILYTCVFLAAKSENYFISIDSFVRALQGTEAAHILDLEFIVLQSLKFTLLVHHPVRPLYGFFLDFQAVLLHPEPVMYDVSVDTLGNLYNRAKDWLNEHAVISDVTFLFTPPQIALAAMYDTDKRITDRYLKRKFLKEDKEKLNVIKEGDEEQPDQNTEPQNEESENQGEVKEESETNSHHNIEPHTQREHYETLVRTIRKCIKIAKEVKPTTREESKEIDKKCFFALNPKKLIDKRIKRLALEEK